MGMRIDRAVSKASKARILTDFRAAARMVARLTDTDAGLSSWHRGFVFGAAEHASLTVKASLLTAFGR